MTWARCPDSSYYRDADLEEDSTAAEFINPIELVLISTWPLKTKLNPERPEISITRNQLVELRDHPLWGQSQGKRVHAWLDRIRRESESDEEGWRDLALDDLDIDPFERDQLLDDLMGLIESEIGKRTRVEKDKTTVAYDALSKTLGQMGVFC